MTLYINNIFDNIVNEMQSHAHIKHLVIEFTITNYYIGSVTNKTIQFCTQNARYVLFVDDLAFYKINSINEKDKRCYILDTRYKISDEQYNILLSIVEDAMGKSIDEITFGLVKYK